MENNNLKKEILWFSGFLVVFIIILMVLGPPSSSDLTIAIGTFILVWGLKSLLFKSLSKKKSGDS
jgi:Flp pilus assembly protein TadB